MILKQFVLGSIENNNYLLVDEETKEAVLIDCTKKSAEIEDALKEYNAKLKYILLTHGHFDHVLGVNYFRDKYKCKAFIHKEDKIMLDNMEKFALNFGIPEAKAQNVDGFISEEDIVKFGKYEIRVIFTPGHTKGGVCYLVEDKIFTGDTLFFESVGRTDLPGGNFNQLKSNIQEKLFTLNEKIEVYPGHGPKSTIGYEKIHNQFL